jgi:hypothetical protein
MPDGVERLLELNANVARKAADKSGYVRASWPCLDIGSTGYFFREFFLGLSMNKKLFERITIEPEQCGGASLHPWYAYARR